MFRGTLLAAAAIIALPFPVMADGGAIPAGQRAYAPDAADQFMWPDNPDILPPEGESRVEYARNLAFDARVFGTSAALEYAQMYYQALDVQGPEYTGFNRFAHGTSLARPGYAAFKTPNADTLYSNAWLDLTEGPVLLRVPDAGETYFTANFIDIYGNSSNISARTRGFGPGLYAIVPEGFEGEIPDGAEKFTVTTPYAWILLRVLARDLTNPVAARKVQAGFELIETVRSEPVAENFPDPAVDTVEGFLKILDWVVREAGYPITETALVHRYRALGVGLGPAAVDESLSNPDIAAGAQAGFALAGDALSNSAKLSGYPAGTWKTPADTGAYGYNYVYRSAIHTLGTGANVGIENYPFNTFVDAEGDPLDASQHSYRLTFDEPPPARFFWSLTMYDARTKELVPNPIDRYLVNDRTPGMSYGPDGKLSVTISHAKPRDPKANWLPAPAGPFYLVIRAQGPEAALLDGTWLPPEIEKVRP